jgi:hypothetical protein
MLQRLVRRIVRKLRSEKTAARAKAANGYQIGSERMSLDVLMG